MRKFPKDLIDGIQKKFPFLQRTPKTAEQRQEQVKECKRQKRSAESETDKEMRLKKKKQYNDKRSAESHGRPISWVNSLPSLYFLCIFNFIIYPMRFYLYVFVFICSIVLFFFSLYFQFYYLPYVFLFTCFCFYMFQCLIIFLILKILYWYICKYIYIEMHTRYTLSLIYTLKYYQIMIYDTNNLFIPSKLAENTF